MENGENLSDPGPWAKLEVSGKVECHHRVVATAGDLLAIMVVERGAAQCPATCA